VGATGTRERDIPWRDKKKELFHINISDRFQRLKGEIETKKTAALLLSNGRRHCACHRRENNADDKVSERAEEAESEFEVFRGENIRKP
jgi:hypothetical protein